ncbi:MAG: ATP synthase F1 subunit epsilon [Deltaproteobacteria bacterium]|nr:ATP synthase F1 subunit epsilon [Deltaproteobacteria bacterium]
MSKSFLLRLLTPDSSIFEDDVEAVIVPGEKGEFGVLGGHTKFITSLVPGILRYVQAGQTRRLAISGGFAEVYPEGVTVLADTLESSEEIDLERSEISRKEVLKALEKKGELDPQEIQHLEARLARAVNRIKAVKTANSSA